MHIKKQSTTGSDREKEVKLFKQAQQGCRASLDHLMVKHEGLVQVNVRRQWPGHITHAAHGHQVLNINLCRPNSIISGATYRARSSSD